LVLGIPNRFLVFALLAAAFIIPKRTETAGAAVQTAAESISGSLSALGSTRIEPVFNPTIGLGGNIGSQIVSRAFGAFSSDDPSGDPDVVVDPTITVDPVADDPLEYEKTSPVWQRILEEEYGN